MNKDKFIKDILEIKNDSNLLPDDMLEMLITTIDIYQNNLNGKSSNPDFDYYLVVED